MSEISKVAVYDPRIVQDPPKYAVQKGALSISTSQFAANSASAQSLSFQVLVPSLNVFVDRKVEFSAGLSVYMEAVTSQNVLNTGGALTVAAFETTSASLLTQLEAQFPPVITGYELGTASQPHRQQSALCLPKGAFTDCTSPTITNTYHPVASPRDLCLSMFPLQTLCSSMTATINDCSVSLVGDTFHEQLLLAQTSESVNQRTCASKTDRYAWSKDDVRTANGQHQGYGQADYGDIPNGAWPLEFLNPVTGTVLNNFDCYEVPNKGGFTQKVYIINGRPAFIPTGSTLIGKNIPSQFIGPTTVIAASNAAHPIPIMFRFRSVEPLCISPFLWQDAKQFEEVGLYGVTNMTVNMNFNTPAPLLGYDTLAQPTAGPNPKVMYTEKYNQAGSSSWLTRSTGQYAWYGNMQLSPPTTQANTTTGPWDQPRLVCTFLTPPPQIPLPPVSSVPYSEFPRYTSTDSIIFSKGYQTVTSNTVSLSSIPDLLVVYVKSNYRSQSQMDTYMPIRGIQVTFDNYANLCANFTQEDLYGCAQASGLDMDFDQFRGYAQSVFSTGVPTSSTSNSITDGESFPSPGRVQLSGAPTILRMGQDIPLSNGLAPGTLGNYSIQVTATIDNSSGFFNYINNQSQQNNVTITIMAVNSGFFETIKGSSAIRKTILNTVDVQSASMSTDVTTSSLARMSGSGSMQNSSALTKQWKGYTDQALSGMGMQKRRLM
jgi:hypothetical protein